MTQTPLRSRLTQLLSSTTAQLDAEVEEHRRTHPGFDWQVAIVLLVAAGCLTIQEYGFRSGSLFSFLEFLQSWKATSSVERLLTVCRDPANRRLAGLLWWATGAYLTYVVIPGFFIVVVFRQRMKDYGLKLRGMSSGLLLYVGMLGVMFPLIWYFSTTDAFQGKYPFYKISAGQPLWPRFFIWEVAYVLQFVALEFFFRGFLVHGTRRSLGIYSIFVMMVPYCMIHYGKPMPETCGAIIAGVALGFMSLKTRSIWLGAALHIAVALMMDSLSLWRQGILTWP